MWATWSRSRREGNNLIIDSEGKHLNTLIWLHPYNRHPDMVLKDMKDCGIDGRNIRVVAPRGLPNTDTLGCRWFEYCGAHDMNATLSELHTQRDQLLCLLKHELSIVPSGGGIVIGGLSQGASMALDLLLHATGEQVGKIRGVYARRGCLQPESVLSWATDVELNGFPVMATLGALDAFVPYTHAIASYAFLENLNVNVQCRTFYGDHCEHWPGEAQAIGAFISQCFSDSCKHKHCHQCGSLFTGGEGWENRTGLEWWCPECSEDAFI